MYFLYSVLLTIGVAALLPRFIVDAVRHGKYAAGFRQRAGFLPPLATRGHPIVWLHCVSVGEAQAARPLARALLDENPSYTLVVSTTTATGQRLAREAFVGQAAAVFYFPFDWAWAVRRTLRAINPSVVLIMETELWPRFLRECRGRGVRVALVNGRISETSFRRYRKIKRFMAGVLNDLSLALMQTGADAERISALGLSPERIRVSGNIKFDADAGHCAAALTEELNKRFHLDRAPVLLAASTHAPEERILLEAFSAVRAAHPHDPPRLIIAPRHPERFDEVAGLIGAAGFRLARRGAAPSDADRDCDVVLLDTIGELRAVYPLAQLVFVGGSISRTGGHNVLEPAAAARCIITGAHTFNFASIVRDFLEQGALVQLPDFSLEEAPRELAGRFGELLGDEARRRDTGERARRALEQSRGATARTLSLLAPLFEGAGRADDRADGRHSLRDLGADARSDV